MNDEDRPKKSGDVKTAASATAGNTTRYDGRMEEVKHTLDFGPPIPGLPSWGESS